mmetsp:Transcript_141498/g.257164  ORF Transcript_141498/g.257164 Transcript_141498/m.257164 type:complete len:524 (-) Transcript_141498:41-1612(-)
MSPRHRDGNAGLTLILGACQVLVSSGVTRFCKYHRMLDALEYRDGIILNGVDERESHKTSFLPVYSSMSLRNFGQARPNVTSMMIFIHTHGRRAEDAFCNAMYGVRSYGAEGQVLVITPYFSLRPHLWDAWMKPSGNGNSSDGSHTWPKHRHLRSASWSTESWLSGGNSDDEYTTSFDVLDQLAEIFLRGAYRHKHLKRRFPNLNSVAFFGFSAAGQLTSRHAFFSRLGDKHLRRDGKHVRWFVADCASYLYLTPERPAPECSVLRDTGMLHSCERFTVPSAEDCLNYNRFKYGLGNLSAIVDNMYLLPYVKAPHLLEVAAVRFLERDVHFTFGGRDVCNCRAEGYQNNKSQVCYPANNSCDKHQGPPAGGYWRGNSCCDSWPDALRDNVLVNQCEDMRQGSNRLQRGLNYKSHLERTARQLASRGKEIRMGHTHDFFHGGHDVVAMLVSNAFRQWLLAPVAAEVDNSDLNDASGFNEAWPLQILMVLTVGCTMLLLIVAKLGRGGLASSRMQFLAQPLVSHD